VRDGDSVGGEAVRALHVADLGRKERGERNYAKSGTQRGLDKQTIENERHTVKAPASKGGRYKASRNERLRTINTP